MRTDEIREFMMRKRHAINTMLAGAYSCTRQDYLKAKRKMKVNDVVEDILFELRRRK